MAQANEYFALTNPIRKITGKSPDELTREDLVNIIIDQGIERITFHYTALDGKVKELRIPVCNRAQVETILAEGERVDGSSLFKGIVDAGKSDLYVIPVYKSAFFNPFDEASIDFMCRFIDKDGNLAEFAPDNVLLKAARLLNEKTGFELYALGELEFYLLGHPEDELFPPEKQKGYHSGAPFVKNGEALNEMLRYITQICGNVKYAHNEVGSMEVVVSDLPELDGKRAEQVEIEFLPVPIEDAADHLVLAKWIIRNVAYNYGYAVTFVPKLETGHAGNGMHVHMMLRKDGRNALVDGGELNENAKKLIGGLSHYAPSLTAFGNTVAGSYLRLVPHQEAPTNVCWSAMNRSALIRVPLGWSNVENLADIVNPGRSEKIENPDSRQTVELRSPDGSAHTHFLLAGITMAAEWGLANPDFALEIADRCHVEGNIHDHGTENLDQLATSCAESAEKLIKDRSLYVRDGIFTDRMIDHMAELLRKENDKELNKRLMSLPEAEKLDESRRIMHRDLHKH